MTGRLSQRDGFGKNPLSNALSQTSFRHDIDAASQEPLQIENQRRVIHEAPAGRKIDEKVDIAIGFRLAASDRTKHADMVGTVLGGKL